MTSTNGTPVALVTGGSAGLGLALVSALSRGGWRVVTDARHADALVAATAPLPDVTAIHGDVRDPTHQNDLAAAVGRLGRLDLLVHNASELGPMRPLADVTPDQLAEVLATNLYAPLGLTRRVLPVLRASAGALVGISSDAAVEHYPTWGAYAAGKAALDHLVLTIGAENDLRAYAVDPGDLRTAMHQRAFPGEDISDRPLPETVVPRLLALVTGDRPPGRYRAIDEPALQLTEVVR
ncbi:SDR family NAD(P)-dependent oxidoreductase [Nocardioides sp. CER19]|uniref:SDR family oxidoreductase n=1 Tax=Nocardioides sp. CER19 TaxID=3038538 RepID=UPI00244BA510|nr:SDR family NAD(P)-dependent oxidoreductase [Nocardioides sp. CER19]MDH2415970.1 SDR family NAD(P)-dependent oxidoreductase [Nocardioides sp. CER19]